MSTAASKQHPLQPDSGHWRCPITFSASFAIADCAARLLAMERPSKRGSRFLRSSAVASLRYLWRTGDVDARQAVVARTHIWLGTDDERRNRAYKKAAAARKGGVQ